MADEYRACCARCAQNAAARASTDYTARPPAADAQYQIQRLADAAPAWLKKTLPHTIFVATMAPSADGGMPHTRPGPIVCFPQYMDPTQDTFNHEMIHIHQRTHAALWDSLYARVWGFTRYDGTLPAALLDRVRLNPDTILRPLYIWQRTWVPLPVFTRPDSPSLGATRLAWYNARTGVWQMFTPPEFEAEFGELTAAEGEHPHELAAYWLSTLPAPNTVVSSARARMEEAVLELEN